MSQRARRARVIAAWVLLVGSIIGWPVSAITVAKGEPPFILGLSWLAIILAAAELLTSSQVHEEQGGNQSRREAPNTGIDAAAKAAEVLNEARQHELDLPRVQALVTIADGWTRLHTALNDTSKSDS